MAEALRLESCLVYPSDLNLGDETPQIRLLGLSNPRLLVCRFIMALTLDYGHVLSDTDHELGMIQEGYGGWSKVSQISLAAGILLNASINNHNRLG